MAHIQYTLSLSYTIPIPPANDLGVHICDEYTEKVYRTFGSKHPYSSINIWTLSKSLLMSCYMDYG